MHRQRLARNGPRCSRQALPGPRQVGQTTPAQAVTAQFPGALRLEPHLANVGKRLATRWRLECR